MNNLKLLIGILFFASIHLNAQTKEQVLATNIMNNVFENKVKFNPKKTKRISLKETIDLIQSNKNLSKKNKDELIIKYYSTQKKENIVANITWTILFEVDGQCGPMQVFITRSKLKNDTKIDLFILPESTAAKNCASTFSKLREVYFGATLGTKNIEEVHRTKCIHLDSEENLSCVNVITFVDDAANVDTENECSNRKTCPKKNYSPKGTVWIQIIP